MRLDRSIISSVSPAEAEKQELTSYKAMSKLDRIGRTPLLKMMNVDKDRSIAIEMTSEGLMLKPVSVQDVYKKLSKKYRKSLDKLSE